MSIQILKWSRDAQAPRFFLEDGNVCAVPGYIEQAISVGLRPEKHHRRDLHKARNILRCNQMVPLAAIITIFLSEGEAHASS